MLKSCAMVLKLTFLLHEHLVDCYWRWMSGFYLNSIEKDKRIVKHRVC